MTTTIAQSALSLDGAPGLLLVLLGAAGVSLLALALARLLRLDSVLRATLEPASVDHAPLIRELRLLAEVAQREGPASLAESARAIRDPFLARSLRLAAEAATVQEARATLSRELESTVARTSLRARLLMPISSMAAVIVPLAVGAAAGILVRFWSNPSGVPELAAGGLLCMAFLAFALNALRMYRLESGSEASQRGIVLRNSLTIVGLTAIRAGEDPAAVEDRLWRVVGGDASTSPARMAA